MDNNGTVNEELKASKRKPAWIQCGLWGAVCALVIGWYASATHSGVLESSNQNAADSYYNLLVRGFQDGHLGLKKEVPSGLAQLADAYDPAANARYRSEPYRLLDMSYYKGRLYLYFGVTPALVLFWPYAALTGHYLLHRQAVAIFCSIGFLASAGLLGALWRRYFAAVSVWVLAAGVVALGLATGVPVLLSRSDVYEVPISCGYMLVMLALAALWCGWHETQPRKLAGWLAAASAAYGLAVGARPGLLFGAVILLAPVVQAWRRRRPMGGLLMAATVPLVLIGLGLMVYNARRFDSPWEFGLRYQLAGGRQDTLALFSLRYFWFNIRVFFLEPVRWSRQFPFVREIAVPPVPLGHHGNVEETFGVLSNVPVVWLALAVPLAWRNQSVESGTKLRGFLGVVGVLVGICALTLSLFFCAFMRYEVEFLPGLVLLAVVGIIGLERALADRPVRRRAVRAGWGVLLGVSVAINLLVSTVNYAKADNNRGVLLAKSGKVQEAIAQYEWALRINPDFAEPHYNLGIAFSQMGKLNEAIEHFEQALRIKPDSADAHSSLGTALKQLGKTEEAIRHYEQALRIKPDFVGARCDLGNALLDLGRLPEAMRQYNEALRIRPDYAEAHNNLGAALFRLGRVQEAMGHWEQALSIKPDYAEAHYSLGIALVRLDRIPEAAKHWEQALRIKPDYAEAHYNLGLALEIGGRVQEAIGHYQQALRIKPDYTEAQDRLARLMVVR